MELAGQLLVLQQKHHKALVHFQFVFAAAQGGEDAPVTVAFMRADRSEIACIRWLSIHVLEFVCLHPNVNVAPESVFQAHAEVSGTVGRRWLTKHRQLPYPERFGPNGRHRLLPAATATSAAPER